MLGDESTTGREEQQYSCDVEICGRNQVQKWYDQGQKWYENGTGN